MPRELKQMSASFNWFFNFINIGSLTAVTVLVHNQDNLGGRWGYNICAVAVIFGLLVFFLGMRRYQFEKLMRSPLTEIAAVLVAACWKRHVELSSDPSSLFDMDDTEDKPGKKKKKQKPPHSNRFRFLDRANNLMAKCSATKPSVTTCGGAEGICIRGPASLLHWSGSGKPK